MKITREKIIMLLLCVLAITGWIVIVDYASTPEHNPMKRCGRVVRTFTALESAGYKRGSTERPHIVFEHPSGYKDDIEVSFDMMANAENGDTLCLDFCQYTGCSQHYLMPQEAVR